MLNWGGFRVAFAAAMVLFFVQASTANPVPAQKDPDLEVDDSGDSVIATVLILHDMTADDLIVQKLQGGQWSTIGEEWEAVETPSADDERFNRHQLEAPCTPPGTHEFRIAFVEDDGEEEFHKETLTCGTEPAADSDTVDTAPGEDTSADSTTEVDTSTIEDTQSGEGEDTDAGTIVETQADCSMTAAGRRGMTLWGLVLAVFL